MRFVAPITICFVLSLATAVDAQVAISVGVSEIYDDNIFLEDDKGLPVLDPAVVPPEVIQALTRPQNDNDPNDDLITNPYLGLATMLPLSKYYDTNVDGRVGGLIFADESDESRVTLDGSVKLTATEHLIPDAWSFSLRDSIRSGANDIAVAEGTASKQTQTNEAALDVGYLRRAIFDRTDFSGTYGLTRLDYLGTFGDDSSDTFEGNNVVIDDNDDEGSDYFQNSIGALFTHHWSDQLDLNYNNRLSVLNFTDVKSQDTVGLEEEDLNRIEWNTTVGPSYRVSDKFSVSGEVGISVIELLDDPRPRTVAHVGEDGTITTTMEEGDSSTDSLIFSLGLSYTPYASTSIASSVSQSQGTDIDGSSIIIRSVSANLSQRISDRLIALGSGRFVQFEDGDSLSDATERYEASASLKYILSEALALSLGYNYVTQDAGDSAGGFFSTDTDYEGNRVFLTLDAGFVANG